MPSALSPIALFDSGAGGIGVLREVKKLLPWEQFLYFGDAANAPYGEKPICEVRTLVLAHTERLLRCCKALVLACNTATAVAAEELRRKHPNRIIVGMEPALRPAVLYKENPTVLVLATAATLQEKKFEDLAKRYAKRARILSVAAPGIVTLVEKGRQNSPEMLAYLSHLLSPLLPTPPDAVVLGCTHFPFAKKAIRAVLGKDIPLFDGAEGTARELARRLSAQGLLAPQATEGEEQQARDPSKTPGDGVHITASDPLKLPLYRALYLGE